jgi:hypothetical protein
MIHDFRNAHQLVDADALAPKQLIDVRFLAIYGFRQPRRAPSLSRQLLLDYRPNMQVFFIGFHTIIFAQK